MPIYKMHGKRNGEQKYRVRINYQDGMGGFRQIDRVAYGSEEAKLLEMKLNQSVKEETPSNRMTCRELFDEYKAVKMEYTPKNPFAKLGNFKSTIEPKKEMDFYTSDEF